MSIYYSLLGNDLMANAFILREKSNIGKTSVNQLNQRNEQISLWYKNASLLLSKAFGIAVQLNKDSATITAQYELDADEMPVDLVVHLDQDTAKILNVEISDFYPMDGIHEI